MAAAANPGAGMRWPTDDEGSGLAWGADEDSPPAAAPGPGVQPAVFTPVGPSAWPASDDFSASGAAASPGLSWADAAGSGPASGSMGQDSAARAQPDQWYDPDDMENEPPLLQELGVDMSHIKTKLLAIVDPRSSVNMEVVQDGDLLGPLLICLALGFVLLLRGQVHFGSIYGFGLVGCVGMYLVLNLMAAGRTIDAASVFSIFGYGLLPVTVLAALSVVLPLSGPVGLVLAPGCIAWSTWSATRFFEAALGMSKQRALIAYPTFLLYVVFALLAVF